MGKKKGKSKASGSKKSSSNNSSNVLSGSSQAGGSSTKAVVDPVLDQDTRTQQRRAELTEAEMEAILLKKVTKMYDSALSFLVDKLGVDRKSAMVGVLAAGSCYGQYRSAESNIIKNSTDHLMRNCDSKDPVPYSDLNELLKFNVEFFIRGIEMTRPSLSRADAMLSLVKSFPVSFTKADLMQIQLSEHSESKLEEMLCHELMLSYKKARDYLIRCGHNKLRIARSILSSGDCLGPHDPVTNILLNCLPHLLRTSQHGSATIDALPNLQQLLTRSVCGLVKITQELCPSLSRYGAMRTLLAYDLDCYQIIDNKNEIEKNQVNNSKSSHNFVKNEKPVKYTRADLDTKFQLIVEKSRMICREENDKKTKESAEKRCVEIVADLLAAEKKFNTEQEKLVGEEEMLLNAVDKIVESPKKYAADYRDNVVQMLTMTHKAVEDLEQGYYKKLEAVEEELAKLETPETRFLHELDAIADNITLSDQHTKMEEYGFIADRLKDAGLPQSPLQKTSAPTTSPSSKGKEPIK